MLATRLCTMRCEGGGAAWHWNRKAWASSDDDLVQTSSVICLDRVKRDGSTALCCCAFNFSALAAAAAAPVPELRRDDFFLLDLGGGAAEALPVPSASFAFILRTEGLFGAAIGFGLGW